VAGVVAAGVDASGFFDGQDRRFRADFDGIRLQDSRHACGSLVARDQFRDDGVARRGVGARVPDLPPRVSTGGEIHRRSAAKQEYGNPEE